MKVTTPFESGAAARAVRSVANPAIPASNNRRLCCCAVDPCAHPTSNGVAKSMDTRLLTSPNEQAVIHGDMGPHSAATHVVRFLRASLNLHRGIRNFPFFTRRTATQAIDCREISAWHARCDGSDCDRRWAPVLIDQEPCMNWDRIEVIGNR